MIIQAIASILMLSVLPGAAQSANSDELVCPVRPDRGKDLDECPCVPGWKPTQERLADVLRASKTRGFNASRPSAVLFNADLTHGDLRGAVLFQANLRGTRFGQTNLEGAYLNDADSQFVDECSDCLSGNLDPGERENFKVRCGGCEDGPLSA